MAILNRLSQGFARMIGAVRPRLEGDGADTGEMPELGRRQAVFSVAPVGILVVSADGLIDDMNPAAENLLGYRAGAAMQFEIARLLSLGGDPAESATSRLRALAEEKCHSEIVGWHRDGTAIPIEASAAKPCSASDAEYLIFLHDLRDRRRSEEKKGEFVATVSHELRTPLTSIAGSLGLLASGAGGALPEGALRLVRIAQANSQRLVRLVDDLLDMQRIETGALRFDMRPIRVMPLIEQAIEDARPFADGFGVALRLDPLSFDGVADTDPGRLSQVVTNLLSNAIKFSRPGGTVDVSVIQRDSDLRICVRDRGEGIPEDFRHRIFEKFAQADRGDSRHKGGSGLGLSIVQQIMIRMNGDVGFVSPPEGGTVFHVDVPLGNLPASSMPPASPLPGPGLPELAGGRAA